MEEAVDAFCERPVDAVDLFQIDDGGAAHALGRAEGVQQGLLAAGADAFITDTFDPATGACGATGKTHDYAIDVKICEAVKTPVMLSGGLTPENVKAAVEYVKPHSVDVSSGVEYKPGVKDPDKVRRFIEVTSCL